MIRVLIADDNAIVRHGIAAVLGAAEPPIAVVAQAANGREAVELAREHRPDVVLLDLQMPVMDGVQAAEALADEFRVVMLTYSDDEPRVTAAIRAGACGYLVHGRFEADELAGTIRRAARGETVMSPVIASAVFAAVRHAPNTAADDADANRYGLTEREHDVMRLLATGKDNRAVAEQLVLTEKTVKNYVHRIYRKLGVSRRSDAIAQWVGSSRDETAG